MVKCLCGKEINEEKVKKRFIRISHEDLSTLMIHKQLVGDDYVIGVK